MVSGDKQAQATETDVEDVGIKPLGASFTAWAGQLNQQWRTGKRQEPFKAALTVVVTQNFWVFIPSKDCLGLIAPWIFTEGFCPGDTWPSGGIASRIWEMAGHNKSPRELPSLHPNAQERKQPWTELAFRINPHRRQPNGWT